MKTPDTLQNRQPAVAGSFYPSDPAEIQQMLKLCFAKAPAHTSDSEVMAIISPHAGYVFSGEVAAAAFSQLDSEKEYKTIFILGSSHRNSFAGASIYSIGNYTTPLGAVKTDLEIAQKLATENKVLSFDPHYHKSEHSLEVQIPFLQFFLKKDFKIVPILLGTQDPLLCQQIAKALKPYFSPENLFVISTDFSHYPAYKDAFITDHQIADAIVTNNPDKFLNAVENCTTKKIENLSTGCCSWPSVLSLMYLTEEMSGIAYKQVLYKNSGDSQYGEMDRVVGYYALSVLQQKSRTMALTDSDKKELLQIARNTIKTYLQESLTASVDSESLSNALLSKAGAFVTLKKAGELCGCIGHFEADKPLYKIVQQMAIASATQDYRFDAVNLSELEQINIEISVLSPMQKLSNVNNVQLGIDGIYIKKGSRSGTFLPQVATETHWSLEEFLGHCARDKAGIGWDGWKDKDAEIYVYQAFVFGEKE
ncbi:MAG: AmmeMemoRadiSam system protein B [Bacteroidales bacterium]|nr:AmmeMemoRadiSam system protein B [Bacteroidales bacterium]